MQLTNIQIQNFRLIQDLNINIDKNTTVIVGRNNTAKTSSIVLIKKILENKTLSYYDYPLFLKNDVFNLLKKLNNNEIDYETFLNKFPSTSITFTIDYSAEQDEELLSTLSPFIIDLNYELNKAIIKVEYKLSYDASQIKNLLSSCIESNSSEIDPEKLREALITDFPKMFKLNILAINPEREENTRNVSLEELKNLFPFYSIFAERHLDESDEKDPGTLKNTINNYFTQSIENIDPKIAAEIEHLRKTVEKRNNEIQLETSQILSGLINKSKGFGYPNTEELELGVQTKINLDNHIQNNAELTYSNKDQETLPSFHNGLGYKNLIKIQFELAYFADIIKPFKQCCIPLLFIEEPESHMHPQMQQNFISYIEQFLSKLSESHIQTIITTHSSQIANTVDFNKIRYTKRYEHTVICRDLKKFAETNSENLDFIKKYLTLTKCDLFFADKAILVEGASERILIPYIINNPEYKLELNNQYYTLIEIGGAYAYKFINLMKFLDIPTLILTDIDSIDDNKGKSLVSSGKFSSNSTINHWLGFTDIDPDSGKRFSLQQILNLTDAKKTIDKIHIAFQTKEKGFCGRSLEEAIKNVNRSMYGLAENIEEKDLEYKGNGKMDFALHFIEETDPQIPEYILNGLKWLSECDG